MIDDAEIDNPKMINAKMINAGTINAGTIQPRMIKPCMINSVRPRRPPVVDVVVTLLLVGLVCFEYARPGDDGMRAGDQHVSLVLSVLLVLPLVARRVAPLPAFAAMCGALALPSLVVAHTLLFFGGLLPLVLGVYSVFRGEPARRAAWALLLLGAALTASFLRAPQPHASADLAYIGVMTAVAAGLGVGLRHSAARRDQLADVLDRLTEQQSVRERLALLDERHGMARDLHDVVAHAVSLMLVQAGAARLAVADDPDLAEAFLGRVEQAGRDAEGELSAMLRALRGHERDAGAATEGLGGLEEMLGQLRSVGLEVRVEVAGARSDLPPALDLAAFRIVQEALTNVVKHAGPTAVTVGVRYGDPLTVTVTDEGPRGPRPAAAGSGRGVIGMRERAALFGGEVATGPHGAGWRVRASLQPDPGGTER